MYHIFFFFFFFIATATTEIYTLSLHDALPIYFTFNVDRDLLRKVAHSDGGGYFGNVSHLTGEVTRHEVHVVGQILPGADRKSTRLNSSHGYISYAVFCLKKKKKKQIKHLRR